MSRPQIRRHEPSGTGNGQGAEKLRGQAQTGSFNVGLMEESPAGSGLWVRTEKLQPGRKQYKFVVDRVNWKEDPNNPQWTDDGFGGHNSVIDVR